jgi:propanol-preferring alcohol dehydrogenase
MTAAVLTALPSDRLEITVVRRPAAEAGDDVVLRVEACGICGTDLHILSGQAYRPELPFILGHEPVGVVVDAGAAAREWLGRRATITLFTGEGSCPMCAAGDERLCPDLRSITGVTGANGAYAEYVRVHARQLIEVPRTLTAPEAASLVDGGATAANSVRVALTSQPGRVLILGAGPIGYLCAEMLAARGTAGGTPGIAGGTALQVVEPNPLRRAALSALGHDVVGSLREATTPVDVVIDCAGAPAAVAAVVDALGPRGRYLLAGYSRVPDFDFGAVSRKEAEIRGIRSGRLDDLESALALAADRRIRLPELATWRLSEVNDALGALRGGRVAGKAIIIPDSQWA